MENVQSSFFCPPVTAKALTWRKGAGNVKLAATTSVKTTCMKRKTIAIVALLAIVGGLYLTFLPPEQDPHYYAAACVAIKDMHDTPDSADFPDKLREVITNENASYAVDKVAFDKHSAQGAIQRYRQLSEQDKNRTRQSIDDCLSVMLPKKTD
ncbi:hypothetical protein ACVWZ0_003678 [Erwinia sp. TECH1]|jgi:hypothetical protein